MKKVIVLFVAAAICSGVYAQQKPATKPTPKVATKSTTKTTTKVTAPAAQPALKTDLDSLSYALGLSLAEFYKQQGIKTVNTTLVSRAINDAMKGGKTLLNEEQMNSSITNYLQKAKLEKSAAARKAGETFLAGNKSKQGVVTLPSGLQYLVIKEGSGPKPSINDTVRCHYTGTLIDGTKFDSSVDRGEPAEFPVGGVIRGWVEALQLMPVGSKWKLFIPSELAYGDNQAGPTIAPGSTLIFDVELLEIVKN
jgi:FKBP-type peptidyl-prolyl cis-trans isomerase FklB